VPRHKAKWIDKDRGWARLDREIKKARRKPHVQVGVFGAEASKDHGGVLNIEVATTHEFGLTFEHPGGTAYFMDEDGSIKFVSNEAAEGKNYPRTQPHSITVPERSFLRGTMDAKQNAIVKTAKGLASGVLAGHMDTKKALDVLGIYIQGEIRRRMSSGIAPPLKAATISRKGSAKPLIDTGQLRASIDYEVKNA